MRPTLPPGGGARTMRVPPGAVMCEHAGELGVGAGAQRRPRRTR